jgi:hypothetical protein
MNLVTGLIRHGRKVTSQNAGSCSAQSPGLDFGLTLYVGDSIAFRIPA